MLSPRATMPRFLDMEQEHGSVIRAMRKAAKAGAHGKGASSGARYSLFVTLRDGLCTMVDALQKRIDEQRVHLNAPVTSLLREGDAWGVTVGNGETLSADAVIIMPQSQVGHPNLVASKPSPRQGAP